MTFSIVGRCARTGQFGVAVTSSSPAVAARCAWARAGVGAVSTQNVTDPALGNRILDLLEAGRPAQDALDEVVRTAHKVEYRQLSVIDAEGCTAVFSGENTLGSHHTVPGKDCLAAGNLLISLEVPVKMVAAFEEDPDAPLAERLIAGLLAGVREGGEEGPVQSAGVLVVDQASYPLTDLRVDWADEPIEKLAEIWKVWQPQEADYYLRSIDPEAAPSYGVPGDL